MYVRVFTSPLGPSDPISSRLGVRYGLTRPSTASLPIPCYRVEPYQLCHVSYRSVLAEPRDERDPDMLAPPHPPSLPLPSASFRSCWRTLTTIPLPPFTHLLYLISRLPYFLISPWLPSSGYRIVPCIVVPFPIAVAFIVCAPQVDRPPPWTSTTCTLPTTTATDFSSGMSGSRSVWLAPSPPHTAHAHRQANGPLTTQNVFEYFATSMFYDKQSNNQVLRMQTMHTGMPITNEAEELK